MNKMKKTGILLLLLLAAALLTACGAKQESTPAATEAPKTTEATKATEAPAATEAPKATEAPAAAEAPAGKSLAEIAEAAVAGAADLAPYTAEELLDMAGIQPEDYTDFVFLQGDGMDGREVLLIRAKDEAAAGRVAGQMEEYLKRRQEENRNYAPEAYRLLSRAKVSPEGAAAGADLRGERRRGNRRGAGGRMI